MTIVTDIARADTAPPAQTGRLCTVTVMDESDPDIRFDADGACQYVQAWQAVAAQRAAPEVRAAQLAATVARITTDGAGKPFDCVIGLSGGTDSSFVALLAKQLGLRPLIVHFDNGWNNELAVANIEGIVTRLEFDLDTVVMDWPQFRDLQRAYFKASVLDLEVPTDHMILGALHRVAARHGVRHILSGTNLATEWLLPRAWHYRKFDLTNLRAIHKRFGERKLTRFPAFGIWQQAWFQRARGIETIPLLDLIDYDKPAAKEALVRELGWRDYGGKHHESVFTRFYQGYILPRKFGIDKRRAHLSQLILSGQCTRAAALAELAEPTYDPQQQLRDKAYVGKKLGFAEDEFEAVLALPNVAHEAYGTDSASRRRYFRLLAITAPLRGRRGKG